MHLDDAGTTSDEEMMRLVEDVLRKERIDVVKGGITVKRFKALPDTLEEFQNQFCQIYGTKK